jgi:sorbitol-specific phosphotransferase system component IIC
LGPKAPESKRGGTGFAGLVQKHGKALVAVMAGLVPAIHVVLGGKK